MSISKRLVRVFWIFTTLAFGFKATAAAFSVTTTDDTIRPGSLRAAIIAANRSGNSVIYLPGSTRVPGGGVYRLTIPGADEDSAQTGDLDITHGNVTIIGVGSNVTIDATGLGDRVFQVFPGAHLTLQNVTITGGVAPTASGTRFSGNFGGAIYNAGTLTLRQCVISNNSSGSSLGSGGDGGGIYNSGMLSANNCQIICNTCASGFEAGNGGALRNDGRCLLTACVINGNRSGDGGPDPYGEGFGGDGGNGGAIYNTGTTILQNCSVGGNSTGNGADGGEPSGDIIVIGFPSIPGEPGGKGGSGGGIYNAGKIELDFCSVYDNNCGNGGNGGSFYLGGPAGSGGGGAGILNAGIMTLNTSTLSGNLAGNGGNGGNGSIGAGAGGGAGGNGGGICSVSNQQSNSLFLFSCTIALNISGVRGVGGTGPDGVAPPGVDGTGGGVWNGTTNATIRNTLIAMNQVDVGANGVGPDVFGNFTSQGFNLLGTADGSTGFTNGINADQLGTDASPIDPLLGPLQMNGGLTPTHALLTGSPAIDQGNSFGIHFDQRHDKRPDDLSTIPNAPGGDGSDIGAFESAGP